MAFENTTVAALSASDVLRPVVIVLDGKSLTGVLDTIWVATRKSFGVFKEKKAEPYVVKLVVTIGESKVEIDKPDLAYIIQIDRGGQAPAGLETPRG